MEDLRPILHTGTPYLKTYVIRSPKKDVKIYGQTHSVYRALNPDIPLHVYIKVPYVIITLNHEPGKAFLWFWYYANDVIGDTSDRLWDSMTFQERLETWSYIGKISPKSEVWYYNNLIPSNLKIEATSEIRMTMDNIFAAIPKNITYPKDGIVSSFEAQYSNLFGVLPSIVASGLKSYDGEFKDNTTIHIVLEDGRHLIKTIHFVSEASGGRIFDILGISFHDRGDYRGISLHVEMNEVPGTTVRTIGAILVHFKRKWYLYEYKSVIIPVIAFTLYRGYLLVPVMTGDVKYVNSPAYINDIYYPMKFGNIVLHGDILSMKRNSPTMRTMKDLDNGITLMKGYKINIDVLLPIWEYINGSESTALPSVESWLYINYLQIPLSDKFVERYFFDLLSLHHSKWTVDMYLDTVTALKNIGGEILSTYRIGERMKKDDSKYKLIQPPMGDIILSTIRNSVYNTGLIPGTFLLSRPDYIPLPQDSRGENDILVIWYIEGLEATYPLLFDIRYYISEDEWILSKVRMDISDMVGKELSIMSFGGTLTVVGENLRVPSSISVFSKKNPKFSYRIYSPYPDNDERRYITGVNFESVIIQSNVILTTIPFSEPVTEWKAVYAVTSYLSIPITQEYIASNAPELTKEMIGVNLYGSRGLLLDRRFEPVTISVSGTVMNLKYIRR